MNCLEIATTEEGCLLTTEMLLMDDEEINIKSDPDGCYVNNESYRETEALT